MRASCAASHDNAAKGQGDEPHADRLRPHAILRPARRVPAGRTGNGRREILHWRAEVSAAAGRKPNSVSAFASALRRRELRRMTIIPLGPALLAGSSDLPGGFGRAVLFSRRGLRRPLGASLFGLAPCGVLPAIDLTADAVRSYRTFSPLPSLDARGSRAESGAQGGIFSVPLSFELPRPGVTRRTALWSSDFPPSAFGSPSRACCGEGVS